GLSPRRRDKVVTPGSSAASPALSASDDLRARPLPEGRSLAKSACLSLQRLTCAEDGSRRFLLHLRVPVRAPAVAAAVDHFDCAVHLAPAPAPKRAMTGNNHGIASRPPNLDRIPHVDRARARARDR